MIYIFYYLKVNKKTFPGKNQKVNHKFASAKVIIASEINTLWQTILRNNYHHSNLFKLFVKYIVFVDRYKTDQFS